MAHTGPAFDLRIFNERWHIRAPALDLRIFNERWHIQVLILDLRIFNRRWHIRVPAFDLQIFNGRRHIRVFRLLICKSLTEDGTRGWHIWVLVLSSTTSALWHSVLHFSSKVPVLFSATSALWHFSFTHRKRRKEMTKRI
ncbi:unnamed protein product [Rhizophagus irregularis]|nr:unnamed protein product [Rhizophagus irregularis]